MIPPSRDAAELIPHNTLATVQMRIRPGNAGENGLLKRSRVGACEMLDVEFVVVDGPHTKRKFWENMILVGTTDGHAKASEISRGKLRSILESSRGIRPDDMSAAARTARTVELVDFNDVLFVAKIGIEKGKAKNDGSGDTFPDKNIIAAVITPEKKDWHPIKQSAPSNGGGSAPPSATPPAGNTPPVAKPTWAS